jgi:putative transcriptional regulator
VQHDEAGAMGVVINREMEISVREACQKLLNADCYIEGNLHQGGPCEGPLMAVHTAQIFGDNAVTDELFFSTDKSNVEQLLVGSGPVETKSKFFIGYSGWTAGQLEGELKSGSWLITEARPDLVFTDTDPWNTLRTRAALRDYVDPSRIPDDPSLN